MKTTKQTQGGQRWLIAGVGFLLLLFLGLIYAWSIFVAPLEVEFGWARSETSLAFTICMSMFCIGGLVAGFLSKKISSQKIIWLCAAFVFIGFVSTSRIHSLWGLYISYGGFVGFGIGLAYNAVISTVTKWFPDKAGLISGILLMGFGFGGMVLGTVCTRMMNQYGWRSTFFGMGVVYLLVVLACSFFIQAPPKTVAATAENASSPSANFTTGEMIKTPAFWLFLVWVILLSASGLALIGHASPYAVEMNVDLSTAALFAGFISIANGVGRVVVGGLYDIIGRKTSMKLVAGGFVLSGVLLYLSLTLESLPLLVVSFITTGLSYGGVTPINSTLIGDFFGRQHYAMNFSVINLNLIAASFLGPFLAGNLRERSGSYTSTFLMITLLGGLALVLSFLIKRPSSEPTPR